MIRILLDCYYLKANEILDKMAEKKMLKKWNECMSFNDVARVNDAVLLVEEYLTLSDSKDISF